MDVTRVRVLTRFSGAGDGIMYAGREFGVLLMAYM